MLPFRSKAKQLKLYQIKTSDAFLSIAITRTGSIYTAHRSTEQFFCPLNHPQTAMNRRGREKQVLVEGATFRTL